MRRITAFALLLLALSSAAQTRKEWMEFGDAAFKMENYASAVFYYQKVLDPGTYNSRDYIFPYDVKMYYAPLDSIANDSVKTAPDTVKVPKDSVTSVTSRIGFDYIMHQIALCYRLMKDYENAEIWYAKLAGKVSKQFPDDKMWYGFALMQNGKYDLAQKVFESITADSTQEGTYSYKRARAGALGCFFALDSNSYKKKTVISMMDTVVNSVSSSSTFAANFFGDNQTLVITAARKDGKVADPKNEEENPFYLCDLYTLNKKDGGWGTPKNLDVPINSGFHEGAGTLSINEDLFFFTRWNPNDPKECAIYVSRFMNGHWLEPLKLPYVNVDGYKSMQPSLSFDGEKLFFASNRPGGKGKMDIWVCSLDESGNPGMPVNLGSSVNTSENEVTPFYQSKTNTLYFSSDGHVGIGGLDIFKAYTTESDTIWTAPVNMKKPINSSFDDSYFVIQNDQKTAYFSTDRDKCNSCNPKPGGHCYNIYQIEKDPPVFNLSGTAYNLQTGEVMPNVLITIKDVLFNLEPIYLSTDDQGRYQTPLPEDFDFFIKAQKNKYFGDGASVSTKGLTESEDFVRDFQLSLIPAGDIVIEGIEYDFDRTTLRPRSKEILDSLAIFLELNDNITIEINSHTDTRGSDSYNMNLSAGRAKSCVDYLISKGVKPERLTWKGYGETVPFQIKDKDGKVITTFDDKYVYSLPKDQQDAAHQKNRRTAFVVIGETKIQIRYK